MSELVVQKPTGLDFSQEEQVIAFIQSRRTELSRMRKEGAIETMRDEAMLIERVRELGKAKKISTDALNEITDYSLEIKDAVGEYTLLMEKNRGEAGQIQQHLTGGNTVLPPVESHPTYEQLGLNKMFVHRAQQIHKLRTDSPELYANVIQSHKDNNEELTAADILRLAKRQKLQETRDSYEKLLKADFETPPLVLKNDALTFLSALAPASVDLLITDPPYMTDVEDIEKFAHSWLPVALARVKATGRAFVCTGPYPAELLAYLTADYAGMELAQILVWTYRNTIGPAPALDYKNNWQAIFYFRGKDAPDLDCAMFRGKEDDDEEDSLLEERFTVQDISAPDGRRAERFHEWQKPDELAHRLIRHSTAEGAKVIDPFAGTGTFLAAASRLKRCAIGSEISDSMLALCEKRGMEVRYE